MVTKWESKVQEATYKFFVVPVIYLLGLYIACEIIRVTTGMSDLFKWILFSGGILAGIIYYYKKNLSKINW